MRKATLIIAAALVVALGGTAEAKTTKHRVKVKAADTARTVKLPGRGADLQLDSVRVGGKPIVFGEPNGRGGTMYGRGVVVRFIQRGRKFYVRFVSVTEKPRVVRVRYHYLP